MRQFTAITLIIAILAAAGCGSTSGSSSSAPSAGLSDKVPGKVTKQEFAGTFSDKQALRKISITDAYCAWSGTNVYLHAIIKNGLNAHVTLELSPVYHLKDAGTHGDGALDQLSIGVNAKATRDYFGNAGHPAGVSKAIPITRCSPQIASISLG